MDDNVFMNTETIIFSIILYSMVEKKLAIHFKYDIYLVFFMSRAK